MDGGRMIPVAIIKEGHPTLREMASPVPVPLTDTDKAILKDMMGHIKMSQIPELADRYQLRPGIGLAAPQINISKRLFVINFNDMDGMHHEFAFVNPEIIEPSTEQTYLPFGEGCLSVDREVDGIVLRHKELDVKTVLYDIVEDKIRHVRMKLRGYVAIVFQHELDHLNGVLFVDRVLPAPPEGIAPLYTIDDYDDEETDQ
jgi:peptide deformylase